MTGKFFHYKPYGWHRAISHNSTVVCYPVGTYNLTHYSILVIYQNNNLNKSWKFCYTSFLLLYTSQAYWIFVKNLVETEIVGHVAGAYMSCENLWRRGRCLSRFGEGWSPPAVAAGGDAPGSPDRFSSVWSGDVPVGEHRGAVRLVVTWMIVSGCKDWYCVFWFFSSFTLRLPDV